MIPLETLTPQAFDATIKDCFYSGLWEHSKCRSELNEREARVLEQVSTRSVFLDGVISGLSCLARRSDLTLRKKIETIFSGWFPGGLARERIDGTAQIAAGLLTPLLSLPVLPLGRKRISRCIGKLATPGSC